MPGGGGRRRRGKRSKTFEEVEEEQEEEEREEREFLQNRPNLRTLIGEIREHVDSDRGLTNVFLHRLALTATSLVKPPPPPPRGEESLPYMGTFSADRIPSKTLLRQPRFSIIVNLKREKRRRGRRKRRSKEEEDIDNALTGHFVVLAAFSEYTFYVDSFGEKCVQEDVANFLRARKRTVYYNEARLQAVESTYCGLFCLLFVLYYHKRPAWSLAFDKKGDLERNERLCLEFLNKLLSV